jgi:hypothetical protein
MINCRMGLSCRFLPHFEHKGFLQLQVTAPTAVDLQYGYILVHFGAVGDVIRADICLGVNP